MSSTATRLEHDLLGDKPVPAGAYYGVQTARTMENFHISGVELRLYPNLIKALAMVKMAAARANVACGQAARLLDHAGQGQSRDSRSRQPGLLPRDRQRPHGVDGR
jgi:aspartate ammonia-lyase